MAEGVRLVAVVDGLDDDDLEERKKKDTVSALPVHFDFLVVGIVKREAEIRAKIPTALVSKKSSCPSLSVYVLLLLVEWFPPGAEKKIMRRRVQI